MFLTVEQAADLLQFAPATVRRFALSGALPAAKVGKFWRFDESLLNEWLRTQSLENAKPCLSVDA
jgi:excisionase family DNA binding protein